ncbi:MAG: efflux RND transporter periplasmic adaptor subunit [Fimbriimonadaceae bacterium]|nr:efflux RND transporter periplasmic adaptor subunit [Fimbriimonadaceae bacterium]
MTQRALLSASLGALALALAGCGSGPKPEPHAAVPVSVSAPVAEVVEIEVPETLEATGTVRAKFDATLSAKIMGQVLSVAVREGDRVRAGQTLVTLDARDLSAAIAMSDANLQAARVGVANAETAAAMEAQMSAARVRTAQAALDQARAALGSAKANLALAQAGPRDQERTQAKLEVARAEAGLRFAESERQRTRTLYAADAISRRQLESAEAAYAVAKAQYDSAVQAEAIAREGTRTETVRAAEEAVRQAEGAVRQAEAGVAQARAAALQVRLRKDEIRAAAAQVVQGQAARNLASVNRSYATITAPFDGIVAARMVDPGATATPGAPLLTILGGPLRLEATVPESALRAVRLGATTTVRVDASGEDLEGKVVEILPQGDRASHTFLVRLELPSRDIVKAGMFGRAWFETGRKRERTVPSGANWERDGLRYVFVVNQEGIARLRAITVGKTFGGRTVVLSGLEPGERVVADRTASVQDGAKVEGR